MKYLRMILSLCLILGTIVLCTGTAAAEWDPAHPASLTLQYLQDGNGQEGLGITS